MKKEGREYIIREFNSSLLMTNLDYSYNLLLVRDNTYLRHKKLNSLSIDSDSTYVYDDNNKTIKCLFCLDFKNNVFRIDHDFVIYIKNKYNMKFKEIKEVILELQKSNLHMKRIIEFEDNHNDYFMNKFNGNYNDVYFRTMKIDNDMYSDDILYNNEYLDLY